MLTPDELITLSPKAIDLAGKIRSATDRDGDGGKKVTKAEAAELIKAATALAAQLAVDVLD